MLSESMPGELRDCVKQCDPVEYTVASVSEFPGDSEPEAHYFPSLEYIVIPVRDTVWAIFTEDLDDRLPLPFQQK